MSGEDVKRSKFLSQVLRHRPSLIGIELDEAGWIAVDDLLEALRTAGQPMTLSDLERIVATSDKQRFAISPDRRLIRANQGHSVAVDLGLRPTSPPPVLFHGTVKRFVASIARQGLLSGARHHVHLSRDRDAARMVGARRGKPVIFEIDAGHMEQDGMLFYLTANAVWLTEHVPPAYLTNLAAVARETQQPE